MNKVILTGNLTKDVELKATNSGKKYTQFCVAVNGYDNKPTYIDCVAWDKTAELMNQFVSKGSKILVEGRIAVSIQETASGKVKHTNVVSDRVEFLSLRKDQDKKEDFEQKPGLDIQADDLPFY